MTSRGRIDEKEVRHIAHLARLKLSDAEVAHFGTQLNRILDYVSQLDKVETNGVEPTAHALPVVNVFREDTVGPSLGSQKVLANAAASDPPYFKVPKVLDQESAS